MSHQGCAIAFRVEYRVRGNTVTIFECQAEWVDNEVARLKYDDAAGGWSLDWFDRNAKAHRYDSVEPAPAHPATAGRDRG